MNGAAGNIFHPIMNLLTWLPVGSAAVFLYAHRRAARRTARILHEAELDRIHRSKLAFESRLQAMQARVEPQFLFNTLAQVERLYQLDPALASVMLDDLIAYLRAAMPRCATRRRRSRRKSNWRAPISPSSASASATDST
jgi:hypothetical protein